MNWTVEPPHDLLAPIGQMIYHGDTTVPSKLNTENSLLTIEMQIPNGFAYRMVDFHLSLASPDGVQFLDFEGGATFDFIDDGNVNRVGQLLVPGSEINQTTGIRDGGGYINTPDATNKAIEHFVLDQAYDLAFLATVDANVFLRLNDFSNDATSAVIVTHHCQLLQYTIEQYHSSPMHTYINAFGR